MRVGSSHAQWLGAISAPRQDGCEIFVGDLVKRSMRSQEEHWDAAQEGAELVREEEHAAAIAVLSELLLLEPDNEYAYYYLGCAHYELEQYDKALKAYVEALTLAPTYLGAMVNAGHALRMLGRYPEAIRMAQQVLARAPDDSDALFLVGAVSFARGDDAQAQMYLERFLQTNPELEVASEVEGMLELLRSRAEPVS
jgi:tetratricopeptide (TPR) repeat protein